jgi:cell division protein FtsX
MKFSSNLAKNNAYQKAGIIFGIIGTVIIIVLWSILIFHTKGYMFILTQILPAIVGLISSVIKKVWLLSISFIMIRYH